MSRSTSGYNKALLIWEPNMNDGGASHQVCYLVYDTCTKHTAAYCFDASDYTIEGAYGSPSRDWSLARNAKWCMGKSSGGISFDGLVEVHLDGTRVNSASICLQDSMASKQSTCSPSPETMEHIGAVL